MNDLIRTECNFRTTAVHNIVRSIIGSGKCNTKVDIAGKKLTYKNINLTELQLNQLQNSLCDYHCTIKSYSSMYNKKNLSIHVLFNQTNQNITYSI